jgi:predicted ATP-grasp superfamily ATP-dependent carboligase
VLGPATGSGVAPANYLISLAHWRTTRIITQPLATQFSSNFPEVDTEYFISFLTDRFGILNERWAAALGERFGKKFVPVYVLAAEHGGGFSEENYVVLNHEMARLWEDQNRKDLINLIYPEDLNRLASDSPYLQDLIARLLQRQKQVFVLSFTSVWLEFHDPRIVILGPRPEVANRFDDKSEHVRTLETLGILDNPMKVYDTYHKLIADQPNYPFFISASYSSGGIESRRISTPEELDAFYASLRPVNQQQPLIWSNYLPDIVAAPNSNAIVSGLNQTQITCIADQILRDNRYMGNVFPSSVSSDMQQQIMDQTKLVGDYLSQQGYRGVFGMDFLITSDNRIYACDINPRRQGGYLCHVLSAPTADLIKLELAIALGEPIEIPELAAFAAEYVWAHSKLTPSSFPARIQQETREGSPELPFQQIGAHYAAIYYPKTQYFIMGNPGVYLQTGQDRDEVEKALMLGVARVISESYL